ncbi:MAG TPA: peptidoglycan-binding domain-containing protein, partial [Clostridia bacterium]
GIDVYNAKKLLMVTGYNLGTMDSKLDQKTSEAIKKYQSENNLTQTGNLDLKTQESLNSRLGLVVKIIDKQYSKALEVLNK